MARDWAEACGLDAGLTFIGPRYEARWGLPAQVSL